MTKDDVSFDFVEYFSEQRFICNFLNTLCISCISTNIYISSFPICLPANVDGVLHTNVKFFSLSGLWPSNAKHFFVAFPGERKSHRRTLSGQGLANVTDGGLIMVNAPAPFCLGSGSTAVAITHPVVQILPVTESVQSCIQTQFSLPLFKV